MVTANAVGGASYVWSTGHYGASDTITNAGTYTVTVSDAGDVCSASASVTVTSNPDLEISVSGTNDFCESGNGTATVTVTNGTANSFTWSTGSSGTTIGNLSEGVYYVTASDGTCATVDSVTIAAAGSITISTSSVNTSCGRNNGTASVTITSGTVNTITWNTGSSSTSLQNLSAGSYSVTVTDNMGCSATATVSVQSSSSTPVSISSSNLQICPSDSTQICAATGFTTYLWNTGETSRCIWAKNAGNYYITATDANNCTTESNRLSLSVFPQEPIGITVNGNVMTAFYGTNYQWFLNNTLIPGASSSVYTATQTGSYTLQAVDSNGCVGYSTPVNITVTGIENLETLHFSVYPNPSHLGNFILQLGDIREPVVVCLFDVTGKLVEEVQTKTNRVSFGENILAGVYILRLTISEKTFTQKLIKL